MRVAVIGCGSIGSRHARNLKALSHEPYLYDADPDRVVRLATQLSLRGDQMDPWPHIKAGLTTFDAVMICTPASTHAAVARELLNNGYRGPLFVEKPLALSVEECEVFKAWPYPTTMVGYNWRFNPEVREWFVVTKAQPMELVCNTDMKTWPGGSYADPVFECSHEIDLVQFRNRPHIATVTSIRALRDCSGIEIGFASRDLVRLRWDVPASRVFFGIREDGTDCRLYPSARSLEESYIEELKHFLRCASDGIATTCGFLGGIEVVWNCEQAKRMATCRA